MKQSRHGQEIWKRQQTRILLHYKKWTDKDFTSTEKVGGGQRGKRTKGGADNDAAKWTT